MIPGRNLAPWRRLFDTILSLFFGGRVTSQPAVQFLRLVGDWRSPQVHGRTGQPTQQSPMRARRPGKFRARARFGYTNGCTVCVASLPIEVSPCRTATLTEEAGMGTNNRRCQVGPIIIATSCPGMY